MKRILILVVAALVSLAAMTESFAKGGGGSRGGGGFSSGGGFGRSSGSSSGSGFFKSSPSPSLPPARYSPPPSSPKPAAPTQAPSRSVTPTPSKSAAPISQPPKPQTPVSTPKPVENNKFFASDKGQSTAGYDKRAIEAQKHADSAKAYAQAQAKKESVFAKVSTQEKVVASSQPKAEVHDLATARAARENRATELSTRIARGGYQDRDVRARSFFGDTYSQPMPTYYGSSGYSDSFGNPYFWYWLMHRNDSAERDRFIYNRQSEIDPKRLQEMYAADPGLALRLEALKHQGISRNSSYVPAGFAGNEDLIYGDDVVKQAAHKASEVSWSGWVFLSALVLAVLFAGYYLLFGKKWKVRDGYA